MFSFDNFDKRVKQNGVTKAFLAKKIEKHPTIFHDWAKGKSSPSDADLQVIADCLGCTVSYLRGQAYDPHVEVFPANPEKVREHQEWLDQQRDENLRNMADILKKMYPDGQVAVSAEDIELAQRLSSLSPENRARALDYLGILEKQDGIDPQADTVKLFKAARDGEAPGEVEIPTEDFERIKHGKNPDEI